MSNKFAAALKQDRRRVNSFCPTWRRIPGPPTKGWTNSSYRNMKPEQTNRPKTWALRWFYSYFENCMEYGKCT